MSLYLSIALASSCVERVSVSRGHYPRAVVDLLRKGGKTVTIGVSFVPCVSLLCEIIKTKLNYKLHAIRLLEKKINDLC